MPKERGNYMTISMFFDASHSGNKVDRCSQTGILIFMNKYPIHWYIKNQLLFKTSKFGDILCAMKVETEMVDPPTSSPLMWLSGLLRCYRFGLGF